MFECPSPKHCRVINLFCSRGHCDLDLCHQGHLLVKTNIPSKFKCSSLRLCRNKLFSTKGHGDLDHELCLQCHLLVRTNIPSKFKGPVPKHCQVIKLFSTKGPGNLHLCPHDHLLVRTNISTKFDGLNHKHCTIISFYGTKGHGDLDL